MDAFDNLLRDRLTRLADGVPMTLERGLRHRPPADPVYRSRVRSIGPRSGLRHPSDLGDGPRAGRSPGRRIASVVGGLAAAVVLVVGLGGVAAYLAHPQVPTDDDPVAGAVADDGPPIVWDSGRKGVRLRAESLRIEVGDQVFTARGISPFRLASDSMANDRYRSFEAEWREHGVVMRLYIYFDADDTHWWGTEVRIYDGSKQGEWIGWGGRWAGSWKDGITSRSKCRGFTPVADCPEMVDLGLFRSRRGESWTGDLDLVDGVGWASGNQRLTGELHIKGMRLSAFD